MEKLFAIILLSWGLVGSAVAKNYSRPEFP
jgi:hypothetical protein